MFVRQKTKAVGWLLLLALALAGAPPGHGYSVQSHEQLVDLTWSDSIRPLLLSRFPGLSQEQLNEAHAYAYGGCAIQDLGYYPFGKPLFSDLTHYVRSGDFVANLIRDARTADELAFAIGALSHYIGDTEGHREAINPSVAIEFPQLGERYGPTVAYDKNPHAHVRTEFAFDVDQISQHRLAPRAYLEHVGLKVPNELLAKAFFETYGLDEQRVLGVRRPTLRGYRFAVRRFLPRIAYAETVLHRSHMPPDLPGPALTTYNDNLGKTEFVQQWEAYRHKAGIGTYSLAGLILVLPKVGPLSLLAIKGPTAETEERYLESMNRCSALLKSTLQQMRTSHVVIVNRDLDTGQRVRPGGYSLTDETYARLLEKITEQPARGIPLGLKQDIEAYYADPNAPILTRKNPVAWIRVLAELEVIKTMTTRGLAMEADEDASPAAPPGSSPAASPAGTR